MRRSLFPLIALVALLGLGCPGKGTAPPSVAAAAPAASDPAQLFYDAPSCPLESGERIAPCRIGYRTYGKLDAAKSNAILFPTWFTGTSAQLASVVPDALIDSQRFFIVVVDALGNGISSAPSSSTTQPRMHFPRFSIRDMVDAERALVRSLGIARLHAVAGISMGGMQALEWAVHYPDAAERVISIAGTPQLTSHDLLLWSAELRALESDVAYRGGDYEGRPPLRAVRLMHMFALFTAEHRAEETSRAAFDTWRKNVEEDVTFDWNDWKRQLEAMMSHDVARGDGGSLEAAAKRVKAKTLFVVSARDGMVNPGPSTRFAKALGGELLVLEGPCGHVAPTCEKEKVRAAVSAFLAR